MTTSNMQNLIQNQITAIYVGFDGEIIINEDNEWECPKCGNKGP